MKKCINRRCNAQLEDNFIFCPFCGKSQVEKPKKRKRANGDGCIWFRKDSKSRPWAVYSTALGYRENLGSYKTQAEAAADLGVSPQTYNAWEKDISNVGISKVIMVAKYYGVALDDIFLP